MDSLKKRSAPYRYLLPTIFLMMFLIVVPIVMVIGYSFFDNVIVNRNPQFVGLEHYRTTLRDSVFWTGVQNTGVFVFFSVFFHMILGMTFAMLLNTRYLSNTTKAIFRVLYVLPWLFTASVIAILWRLLLHPHGMINYLLDFFYIYDGQIAWLSSRQLALATVTFINIWAGYPFFMVSILAGLQGISSDLYEASAIDGAGSVMQFFYIIIPQLKPILISLIMLGFVWTTHQFALIWMTTGGGPVNATHVLSIHVYIQAFTRNQFSLASASATLILIVCTVIAIFYVRHQKARD